MHIDIHIHIRIRIHDVSNTVANHQQIFHKLVVFLQQTWGGQVALACPAVIGSAPGSRRTPEHGLNTPRSSRSRMIFFDIYTLVNKHIYICACLWLWKITILYGKTHYCISMILYGKTH